MASELSVTMKQLATSYSRQPGSSNRPSSSSQGGARPKNVAKKDPPDNSPEFYDDVYFDSDESEPEGMCCMIKS